MTRFDDPLPAADPLHFNYLLPEPGLVDRIRHGVRAHQAENAIRDRRVRLAAAPAAPLAAVPSQPRPATA